MLKCFNSCCIDICESTDTLQTHSSRHVAGLKGTQPKWMLVIMRASESSTRTALNLLRNDNINTGKNYLFFNILYELAFMPVMKTVLDQGFGSYTTLGS